MFRTLRFKYILAVIFCLAFFAQRSDAQFKEGAFTQNYNEPRDTLSRSDSVAKLFSFKEFFGGLAHKNTLKIGTMTAGSAVFIGASQIYNKDYWKLPIIYGGIGALAGTGGYYLHRYNTSRNTSSFNPKDKRTGTLLLAGAGLVYWGALIDGAVNYQSAKEPDPGRATIYSALLPGLGQIYNGELFKVPIYWGCLLGSVHFLTTYNTNYVRFKRIHNEATNPDPLISGEVPISAETAKWYRDVYRRYRDYSIVATVAFYVLQVIDANVFAYMHDFEVDDNITMNIEPAIIAPDNAYAMHRSTPLFSGNNAVGLRLGISF
jgi:hypothetical protein